MRRPVRQVLVTAMATVLVVGCGGDDTADTTDPAVADPVDDPAADEAAADEAGADEAGADEAAADDAAADEAGADDPAAPPRPAVGTCESVDEAPDGLYVVADAGTAVIQRDGDRLVVGDVQPADGWTHVVEVDDDGDVDVDFQRGQEEVWIEVEITGGQVVAQICADD